MKPVRFLFIILMIIGGFATDLANPPITPQWAFSHIVWEDSLNNTKGATEIVDAYLSRNIPVGAVIIDSPDNLRLWYDRPASYFEEALVIGNGHLGAVVYGGTDEDIVSLNDITLWTGEPENMDRFADSWKSLSKVRNALDRDDYRAADSIQHELQGHYSENYQPLGTLKIKYLGQSGEIHNYRRELDISTAVAKTEYERRQSRFSTEYFASAPDSVIAIRMKSEGPAAFNAVLSLHSLLPHGCTTAANSISMEGYAAYHSQPVSHGGKHFYDPDRGMRFKTILRVVTKDGKVTNYQSGEIKIEDCHEALLLVSNATSFNGFDKNPATNGTDYKASVDRNINRASQKSFAKLRATHIEDYKSLFDRLSISLGKSDAEVLSKPTDRQLRDYTLKKERNPELETLYFQYGRYLLIASSRTPGVPANLQGLWNEKLLPPWCSNYTTNINLQENYWAAEAANLSELHMPLLKFIAGMSINGKKAAEYFYGVKNGWCAGHNSDIWAMSCPSGDGHALPIWSNWTMGGAWLAVHIWEHYAYTLDTDFLKEYYPVLKGAAEFCLNWLVEKDGVLMTSPGTSPENRYITPDKYIGCTLYGNTSDIAIIRECLNDAKLATDVLGMEKSFVKRINCTLSKLAPYKIGANGNLQDWYYDWIDHEPHHRHQSHLYGVFPGNQITSDKTPELAKAALQTLELRGDETTGWSTGWRMNLYARLCESDKAYDTYRRLLKYISPDGYKGTDAIRGGGTYPNLLDAHSPFQIDGNFGGCAGVLEMLVQSTSGNINLLPALPDEWSDGEISGICTRGGFTLDMKWKDGRTTSIRIFSKKGGKTMLNYNGKSKKIELHPNETKLIECI